MEKGQVSGSSKFLGSRRAHKLFGSKFSAPLGSHPSRDVLSVFPLRWGSPKNSTDVLGTSGKYLAKRSVSLKPPFFIRFQGE